MAKQEELSSQRQRCRMIVTFSITLQYMSSATPAVKLQVQRRRRDGMSETEKLRIMAGRGGRKRKVMIGRKTPERRVTV